MQSKNVDLNKLHIALLILDVTELLFIRSQKKKDLHMLQILHESVKHFDLVQ